MRNLLIALLFLIGAAASAESKTFKVGGLHCADCVADVKEKVCGMAPFAKCDVKITNEKKEIGEIAVTTKGADKIDVAKLTKLVEDAGYTIRK